MEPGSIVRGEGRRMEPADMFCTDRETDHLYTAGTASRCTDCHIWSGTEDVRTFEDRRDEDKQYDMRSSG